MAAYTNAYKGRSNRQESASHLRDEFDRIEAAFASLLEANTSYGEIYNYGDSTEYTLIDPANGQMQEITLTQDTLIEIKSPGIESGSAMYRLSVIVHGAGFKIINGWGPQTWKEDGNFDWMWIYTGAADKAGAVLEFSYDGKAWVCLAFSRNSYETSEFPPVPGPTTTATFPLISDLWNVEQNTELTWVRSTYGWAADIDATFVMRPPNEARFIGGRYVKNWVATPKDLQSVAFEEDGVTVSTEAGEGQDGGNVDKITFDTTGGELRTWMLPHFGRASETSDPIKFAISFDAKMAGVVASGTCRAVIAVMGIDSGSKVRWHRVEFDLDNTWNSYGAILDPITGKDLTSMNLNTASGTRTLVKFAIESPSDGVGDPILVENLNVVILKEGDDEKVSLPIVSTIGSSITLAATAGSTGTWDNGTKTMTLALGEYIDFQDSLTIGNTYLCVASRTSGNSVDVMMENDRTYWTAYSKSPTDTSFVKDAPFTFQYEGGAFRLHQTSQSSVYAVNIYLVSDNYASYGTENANTIGANKQITYAVGQTIASNIATGVAYENVAATNLLPTDAHRDFSLWTAAPTNMRVKRSEYGIDGRPGHGTMVEDNATSAGAFIYDLVPITDDTDRYVFSFFVRKTRNSNGSIIHPSQLSASAGGPVTSPSRYLDFFMYLYDDAEVNEANWIVGNPVRLDIGTGQFNINGQNYDYITGIDYQNWWHVQIGLNNNNTGNDRAALVILPDVANTLSTPGTQVMAERGYVIIDWAQLEINNTGGASSGAIPGDPRAADSITTTLADGTLYTSLPEEIGDVTSLVFTFDAINIYKNITWTVT